MDVDDSYESELMKKRLKNMMEMELAENKEGFVSMTSRF